MSHGYVKFPSSKHLKCPSQFYPANTDGFQEGWREATTGNTGRLRSQATAVLAYTKKRRTVNSNEDPWSDIFVPPAYVFEVWLKFIRVYLILVSVE